MAKKITKLQVPAMTQVVDKDGRPTVALVRFLTQLLKELDKKQDK